MIFHRICLFIESESREAKVNHSLLINLISEAQHTSLLFHHMSITVESYGGPGWRLSDFQGRQGKLLNKVTESVSSGRENIRRFWSTDNKMNFKTRSSSNRSYCRRHVFSDIRHLTYTVFDLRAGLQCVSNGYVVGRGC